MKKQLLTPAQRVTKFLEENHVKDGEMQRRYDRFKQTADTAKERMTELENQMERLNKEIEMLKDTILMSAMCGSIVPEMTKKLG